MRAIFQSLFFGARGGLKKLSELGLKRVALGLIRLVLWYGILPPPILQPRHYLSVVIVQLGYCNVRFGKLCHLQTLL